MTYKLLSEGFKLITAIHPSSIIATAATIEISSCVMVSADFNPYIQIGRDVIVNS